MKAGRSPELVLLLLTCTLNSSAEKKVQLSQFLNQHQLNWNYLYTLANRHRITPFLYRELQELLAVPAEFLTKLQHECRMIATDNMLKLQEYQRIAKLLSENKIEHIAFKGIYLVENDYPDSSLRGIGDLDILVDRNNIFKVVELLASNNYQPDQQYRYYMQHSKHTMLSDLYEVSLFKPFYNKSYFDIDLHWEVNCLNKKYASFDLYDILTPPALLKEHQIVLLVVHHGVINMWQKIVYVNDLFFSLKDKDINWAWLLEELRHYGLETVFLVGVNWCQQIWNLALPLTVQELIASEKVRSISEAYEKNWEDETSILLINPGLKQIGFFARSQTRLTKKLKIYATYIQSFVFRSSLVKIGKHRFYMPKELGFLTVFFRIVQGLYKSIIVSL